MNNPGNKLIKNLWVTSKVSGFHLLHTCPLPALVQKANTCLKRTNIYLCKSCPLRFTGNVNISKVAFAFPNICDPLSGLKISSMGF